LKSTATAHANIALIKYWGKRDEHLMLPTKSSLSLWLPQLTTTTKATFSSNQADTIVLNGKRLTQQQAQPITSFLATFRKIYTINKHFLIETENSFPTAAGLASSASGFAALTQALTKLCNLNLSTQEQSLLARRGSGSACRSLFNGFVLWNKGTLADGSDSYAQQLFPPEHWPELKVIVTIVNKDKKKISSRTAMQQTVATSPDYKAWVERSEQRIPLMINAIKQRNITTLGQLAEQDCLEMHHCIQTTTPAMNYWQPKTMTIMKKVQTLRESGIPCYFTIDAGPNVKIITLEKYCRTVSNTLQLETT